MAVVQDVSAYARDEDIRIRDLIEDIRHDRLLVACLVTVLTLAGAAYGLLATKQYEASTILEPVTEGNDVSHGAGGGLSSLASQYGGLASLAGINLGAGSEKDVDIAVLNSELLTENFIRENNLLPVLFAKRWDPIQHQWKTGDRSKVPTLWKGYKLFNSSVRQVIDDRKIGLIRLTVEWKNPQLAAQWANGLVTMANSYLRQQAIEEAERNIAYLNEQLAHTNLVEVQSAISLLLDEQINKEMLAKGREQYALKVIDPAFAAEKPSSPGPLLLSALGFIGGWLLSVFVVFGKRALRT